MFKRVEVESRFLGYSFETNSAFFFFGSRHLSRDELPKLFPDFDFAFLKQIHGHAVVEADAARVPEADGHFTRKRKVALISQTADCVPVLLAGGDWVCALHAGWRGVALNIVSAAAHVVPERPELAILGPHIRKSSFEVGAEVTAQLVSAKPSFLRHDDFVFAHSEPRKNWVDLSVLVKGQLKSSFGDIRVFDPGDDTKTSSHFHSFRRDREKSGRQYSFVVLKS